MKYKTSSTPLVSIIVPVYNLVDLISETMDSILSQTYSNFEVLVVDDASTDNTASVVADYASTDNRIKLLSNVNKKGVSGARNTGINAATGEWMAFLDGDDLWPADSLSARIDCLQEHPGAQLISGDYARFDDSIQALAPSNATTNDVWRDYFSESLSTGKVLCLSDPVKHFLRAALVHTGTVLVDSSMVKKLHGFDERLLNCEDTHLWLRISAIVDRLVFTPKTLLFYRQRGGSLTNSAVSMYHYAPLAYRMLLSDPAFKQYKRELRENICHYISLNSYFYRNNKRYWQALKWNSLSVLYQPLSKASWKGFVASCLLR